VFAGGRRAALKLGTAPDLFHCLRVLKRGQIARRFAEIRGSDHAPHNLRVAGLREIADEQNRLGTKRLAKTCGDERL
jgi:hypothetical protein